MCLLIYNIFLSILNMLHILYHSQVHNSILYPLSASSFLYLIIYTGKKILSSLETYSFCHVSISITQNSIVFLYCVYSINPSPLLMYIWLFPRLYFSGIATINTLYMSFYFSYFSQCIFGRCSQKQYYWVTNQMQKCCW